jgi:hypothetical protein
MNSQFHRKGAKDRRDKETWNRRCTQMNADTKEKRRKGGHRLTQRDTDTRRRKRGTHGFHRLHGATDYGQIPGTVAHDP